LRKQKLIDELICSQSDIICLQEVDHFFEIEEDLKGKEYCGVFKKRTGTREDGCAIFYNSKKLKLIHKAEIEFNDFVDSSTMKKDNIALFLLFDVLVKQDNIEKQSLYVGNTHLFFKDQWVKKQQAKDLVSSAYSLYRKAGNPPLVICGDLNITPKNDVYKFMIDSNFHSVYNDYPSSTDFPYTSLTERPKMLDYMFYTEGLKIEGIYCLPDKKLLLPNEQFPSDHIMLKTHFSFRNTK